MTSSEILRFPKKLYVLAPEPSKPVHASLNCRLKAETRLTASSGSAKSESEKSAKDFKAERFQSWMSGVSHLRKE